ncbi:hypothetical protein H2O64_20980 [Kordia sp. YSTF-M3]|uniref:Uncharacterized protein n=1 Tax=Kordia aestuariivivens TaxID=2759037 RepID=A0ABR7QF07_9FLAO|nr:hypothetical protein [Kordia aestuariivivens]MBC8757157.1 hypothetical protein [Kordia aestuariivivens]
MEQELNKLNPSFVGVINAICERFHNLIENAKVYNEFTNKQNTILKNTCQVFNFFNEHLQQSNKLQQYIRTMKRWHDPSYLGEFWEVTTLTSLLSHQDFFSVKTTISS